MTDIPEDIREAAFALLNELSHIAGDQEEFAIISQALLSERMKERSRCEQIVHDRDDGVFWFGQAIASAIRSGE